MQTLYDDTTMDNHGIPLAEHIMNEREKKGDKWTQRDDRVSQGMARAQVVTSDAVRERRKKTREREEEEDKKKKEDAERKKLDDERKKVVREQNKKRLALAKATRLENIAQGRGKLTATEHNVRVSAALQKAITRLEGLGAPPAEIEELCAMIIEPKAYQPAVAGSCSPMAATGSAAGDSAIDRRE